MSQRTTNIRHQLIINKLRVKPRTWAEIDAFLKRESEIQQYDLSVSQRQFQRDIETILSLYGIAIENDRSTKRYRIADSEGLDARFLEAFDVFNLLKMGGNRTKEVSYDKRRPQGTEHFYGLLHAIRNRYPVTFQYHKFYGQGGETRSVEPYALKEARYRWYLVGKDTERNAIRVFGLDRMASLAPGKGKFPLPADFDVERLFRFSFGVILPNEGQVIETVELSFSPFQ